MPPEPSLEEVLALDRRRRARQDRGGALPDVPRDRRRRRRGRAGAGRLGPRQVGRGDRHRHPQAERRIAQGYDGTELKTTDGLTIQGLLIKQGDPLMMRSQGGVTQIIPANRVAQRRRMMESLMMSAAAMGLTARGPVALRGAT